MTRKGLIAGNFSFLGANIQGGILFIKHDYYKSYVPPICRSIVFLPDYPFNVVCHCGFLFDSDVLYIALKYMYKENPPQKIILRYSVFSLDYLFMARQGRYS